MYIDTHCHLYNEYYDNIDEVLKLCTDKNCQLMIVNGCDLKSSKETLDLANNHHEVYAAIGFHPTELEDYSDKWFKWLENNIHQNKVVAIGEIGLDYHYDNTDKGKEKIVFERQLDLAEKNNIPVIIHSRDATEDTLKVLKKHHLKGVIHGFSGSVEVAKEYIRMGFLLGINGVVTFKNAHLKEAVKELGIKHFVIETDSPYLTPHPHRGEKNYPYNVRIIVSFLANYLNISEEEILSITTNNAINLFNINH